VEGILRIGLPEEPRTLNVWLASDAASRTVLRQIYQPLYEDDPETLEPVPWLAAALPVYDAAQLTYTITLRPAHWSDGTPLTSSDVAFTARMIQEFKIPMLSSRWKQIERIETPDAATIVVHLKKPLATFLSRTLEAAIVPAHQWEPIAQAARESAKPLAYLLNYNMKDPVGSGPFLFKQWRRGDYLYLQRNPHYFATGQTIADRKMGPYAEGLLFKVYGTTDVAMLALRQGDIDMFWQGIQPGYVAILKKNPHIKVFDSQKSALYYMGMNTRRPPFSDVHLRRAVALMIDKGFLVNRLLQGRGTQLFSIIPPGNRQWHNPDVPRYGDGLMYRERLRRAYELLLSAGYNWEMPPFGSQGDIQSAKGLRRPDGTPMGKVIILTPPADYDPARAISGTMIQEWLQALGIPAMARPMEFSALIDQIKNRRDFDAFILGYGRLSIDPDYLGSFFESSGDKTRGLNVSGYRNETFDRLAEESQWAMDPAIRHQMIMEMQRIIMEDVPYVPLYVPNMIEAVYTARFDGWVPMLDGIGNRWSINLVRPTSGGQE
jgi:ABC-type transport system substrate-binding protein